MRQVIRDRSSQILRAGSSVFRSESGPEAGGDRQNPRVEAFQAQVVLPVPCSALFYGPFGVIDDSAAHGPLP